MNILLKTRILASGKTQIALARAIEISEPQLSKIVGGWINPSPELKKKMATALNVCVEDIFPEDKTTCGK